MLDKPLIPFDIVGITTKVTTENFNALNRECNNDRMEPSDPVKCEKFWRETFMTMAPFGLNIEDNV